MTTEEHWLVLRDFVRGQLDGIAGGLLASGVNVEKMNSIVNSIGLGFDNPLNNPFRQENITPFENHLGQKHWNLFANLLRANKHIFLAMLMEYPNNWTEKQANVEWIWLIRNLEQMITNKSFEK